MNVTHLIACIRTCYPSLLVRDARPIEGEGQPNETLWPDDLDAIRDDAVLNALARQLAHFLQALHSIPVRDIDHGLSLSNADGPEYWAELLEDFRVDLFQHMRADARRDVEAAFDRALGAPEQFDYTPALRHGDFGTGNILFDPHTQKISGVIDFDSLELGDPAVDAGAIHAGYGEAFFARMCEFYPQLDTMRSRFSFYQSTYALQEALYGLRDGVQESFEAGIAGYR